jgi:ABC-type oligopeptide transport system, periplasmic component
MKSLRLVQVLITLLVLIGCTSAPSVSEARTELHWAVVGVSDLPSLDPARPNDTHSVKVINLVFSGLVRLDAQLTVQPEAANYWTVSADGRVYTFKLRENLMFGDGSALTAHDFAASINRALQPHEPSNGALSHLGQISGAREVTEGKASQAEGVRVVDDHTLEITLEAPVASFLAQLTFPFAFALPEKAREADASWFDKAFGSGPFRVKQWIHNKEIILEANPYYWRGQPNVATIRMPFYRDSETAYQAYLDGKLDVMGNQQNGVPANRVKEAEKMPDLRTTTSLTVRYIGFNNLQAPFDNRYVRQAFALAVDKHSLAQNDLAGTVVPTDRILPPSLAGSQFSVRGHSYDPVGARAALGLAGFLSGQELPPITLSYGEEGDNAIVVQALQNHWRESLGVEVRLEGLPLAEFNKRLSETYTSPETGLQLYLSIWSADYPDPQNFLSQQLHSDQPNNNGHWSDPEFDALVEAADSMSAQDQLLERLQLYAQAEQIALDKVAWLPLYNPKMYALVRPSVTGLAFTPQGIIVPNWASVQIY